MGEWRCLLLLIAADIVENDEVVLVLRKELVDQGEILLDELVDLFEGGVEGGDFSSGEGDCVESCLSLLTSRVRLE
jgi:hypothetical protein